MPHPVIALSGNPRVGSRTTGAATHVAERLAADPADVRTIDLAGLAGQIFAPEHAAVDEALAAVQAARLVVVATPVYKASYTGLLKSFLDRYGPNGLAGVVAVPLVVSGNPAHALAGEVHLRPLLVELGAVVPARSLTVLDSQLADLDDAVDRWLAGGAADALATPVAIGSAR
ncbi:NADPH-dependent FMN reductase [Cellulomonas rhizosphaerae]|uniref:NADPH-dependent oxidoreductase n=1 Tax=Cellulomonas rhizosphaerae TaxID=2293719 RepID=A0A413RM44_9CELL|nr:NAD(P)H-dependent oxidoreductase [Cellulomonas rhizosphaerae]RHA41620.1 NADPH-dependent oxidoreductase [Cellulomonas rhizosphaerae]